MKSLENELKNLAYTLTKGENKLNANYHQFQLFFHYISKKCLKDFY